MNGRRARQLRWESGSNRDIAKRLRRFWTRHRRLPTEADTWM